VETVVGASDVSAEVVVSATAGDAAVSVSPGGVVGPAVLAGSGPAQAPGGIGAVGSGRASHGTVAIAGGARRVVIGRSPRAIVAGARHQQISSGGRSASGSRRDRRVGSPLAGETRGVSGAVSWLAAGHASALAAPAGAASTQSAARRPARPAASTGPSDRLPVPSPFGPPGRGAVAASGIAGAAAGSGAVCAVLIGLLLVSLQPLRCFRLMPVAVGRAGFTSFQQRPG
jgi:hypothetical protein